MHECDGRNIRRPFASLFDFARALVKDALADERRAIGLDHNDGSAAVDDLGSCDLEGCGRIVVGNGVGLNGGFGHGFLKLVVRW